MSATNNPDTGKCAGPSDSIEQRVDEYVDELLASAPPLSTEQRVKLAELLKPVRIKPRDR